MARSSTSFGPGNRAAVRHGVQSASVTASARAEQRAEIRGLLVAGLPHVEASDLPLVDLACDVISDLRQLRAYIDSRGGLVDRKGKPLGCSALYGSLLRQAIAIFDRLGIGPAARGQVLGSLGLTGPTPKAIQAAEAHRELLAEYAPVEAGA